VEGKNAIGNLKNQKCCLEHHTDTLLKVNKKRKQAGRNKKQSGNKWLEVASMKKK
jgi:hypothetical protein